MDMPEVEGMNMIEVQDYPTNNRWGRRISIWWRSITTQ
jgi:hypothetical protein